MLKIFIYTLVFLTLFLFYVTNSLVTDPYMDEIFHFPQAVKYYKGIFNEWDSKITTPPGLYLFTVAILSPLSHITNLDISKIACFRLINFIFTVGTFYVVYRILQHLHRDEEKVTLLSSFNVTIFPVLYFFNFLYYTDCGSTFFVLLMYYWHMKKFYFSAAVSGAISIIFRQTNIVWVFHVAAEETLRTLAHTFNDALSKKDKKVILVSFSDIKKLCVPLGKKNWKEILKKILKINIGYIPVALASVIFVIYNGSIALGDKTAHEVCIHIPQLFYFLLFFLCFASPYMISLAKAKKFLAFISCHKTFAFEMIIVCTFSIVFMSHAHPYLLADNRHFTFYIWRRILGRNMLLSLGLIPIYMYSCWSVVNAMQHKDILYKVLMAFCIVVSVIPQKLLEFRYFIIPYIMLRVHLKVESKWQPYLEFILYFIVNFMVLHLFLFQRLPWETIEKSIRIMW